MSGHSKWSKVKHQKGAADAKRGAVFSKLAHIITLAAQKGGDPEMNPSLKHAIAQARAENMPLENIQRAVKKGAGELLDSVAEKTRYEAFGPGGAAIVIEAETDNKNRTTNEIKHLLSKTDCKMAIPGSTLWAFEETAEGKLRAKHKINLSAPDKEKNVKIIEEIKKHNDVQDVYANFD